MQKLTGKDIVAILMLVGIVTSAIVLAEPRILFSLILVATIYDEPFFKK